MRWRAAIFTAARCIREAKIASVIWLKTFRAVVVTKSLLLPH